MHSQSFANNKKTAVNTADGIFIRLPAAAQLVEFFLVHWFYQTFRYDIWLVALRQFRYMFGFSPYLTFRTSAMSVSESHFFYDRRPTSSQENSK
jgi:type IV secretory pathway TrbD component